jgi:uncharacterized sulfatase
MTGKRRFFEGLGLSILLLAILFRGAVQAAPPNVLLILSDDQAWTDYGFMGHPQIHTPHLDTLAAQSLTYTRGYVTSPLCRPSLASILTGLPTHVHGTTGNDPETGDKTINNMASRRLARYASLHNQLYERLRALPNFVKLLADAGYQTLQTGKWWEADPRTFGFTHAMTHGDPARGARHGDEGLKISREGIAPIREFLDHCQASGERPARPFCIWHAPFLPHAPHNPPAHLLEKYRPLAPSEAVARYWAMCEWFDETCGELLDELDQRELAQNTLVIYVTDNGWIQDPQRPNRFAERSKTSPYEGGIRTPVMVRWPDRIEPRIDTGTLVSAIDIAPTILRAAGVAVPATMPGIDLRETQQLVHRNAVFGSAFPHNIGDVSNPAAGPASHYMIRGAWKWIGHRAESEATHLYHLEADPHERTDLAEGRATLAAEMGTAFDNWWNTAAD